MKKEVATTPEKAFVRSDGGYELFGTMLPHPFTPERRAAAACMGLRYGFVNEEDVTTQTVEVTVPAEGKKKAHKKKVEITTYPQQFSDLSFVLWLMSVPSSRAMRAERKPAEARSEAFAWAAAQGIGLQNERFWQASGVFFKVMDDINASTGIPVPADGEGSEDDDDDPNG